MSLTSSITSTNRCSPTFKVRKFGDPWSKTQFQAVCSSRASTRYCQCKTDVQQRIKCSINGTNRTKTTGFTVCLVTLQFPLWGLWVGAVLEFWWPAGFKTPLIVIGVTCTNSNCVNSREHGPTWDNTRAIDSMQNLLLPRGVWQHSSSMIIGF